MNHNQIQNSEDILIAYFFGIQSGLSVLQQTMHAPLTRSLLRDGLFYQCFTVFDNLCYQATCHSVTDCQCVTPSFSIALPTCKARKLHKYFIQGSILLCTDSMSKDINSRVLIMQRGDTDLILCLSTCTDILMHSVPATLWHTGDFHTLCSKAGKRRHFLCDRDYITA